MVEVFASNVNSMVKAEEIVELLHKHFSDYQVNFDLDDRENIMRVESACMIDTRTIIDFLAGFNVKVESLM